MFIGFEAQLLHCDFMASQVEPWGRRGGHGFFFSSKKSLSLEKVKNKSLLRGSLKKLFRQVKNKL